MHARTRSFGTIRVTLAELREVVGCLTAAVPADARVRLVRIAGVRRENKALELDSVDDIAALDGLPDVLYDLSVSVVASADRAPGGSVAYRLQLVSDGNGLSLQVFSDDDVWTHGALAVAGNALAAYETEAPAPTASSGFVARSWKPLLAGVLLGAAVATAYYRNVAAAGVLAALGIALWYVIDLAFAVTAPPREPREVPNLQTVVREIPAFGSTRRPNLRPALQVAAACVAVAIVAGVMWRFFPHAAPPTPPHKASAPHVGRR